MLCDSNRLACLWRFVEPRLRPFCRCDVSSGDDENGHHLERRERHKTEGRGKGPEVGDSEGDDTHDDTGPQEHTARLAAQRGPARSKDQDNGDFRQQ